MFQPTQILRDEHDVILRGLEILESYAEKMKDGENASPDSLEKLIEFFRLYADKTHHGKEEALLFPAMVARGFSYESGPIHCMISDHEQNRVLTRQMVEAIAAMRSGVQSANMRFAEAAERYVNGLREHIQKENLVLFNMAEQVLPPAEEPEMMAKFEHVDRNEIGEAEIRRLIAILDTLQVAVPAV
ncbi:MAG TPA: hemerythrin domain-containing protein [Terriglobales bacterium]|nr:hemerythrin domain-containing protein [Terriglobales bacterium]